MEKQMTLEQIKELAKGLTYDIQRFAEGDDPPEEKEIDIGGQKVKLPAAVADSFTKAISSARKDAEKKAAEKFRGLEEALAAKDADIAKVHEELTKIQEASMTAEQRSKAEVERAVKKAQEDAKKFEALATSATTKYQQHRIQTDIYAALNGHDLFSPGQAMILIAGSGRPKLVVDPETGNERTTLTLTIDGKDEDLSPKDFVAKWLALPENLNQVRSALSPGGGSSTAGAQKNGNTFSFTKEQWQDPKIRAQIAKLRSEGKTVTPPV